MEKNIKGECKNEAAYCREFYTYGAKIKTKETLKRIFWGLNSIVLPNT
jgi:hypothetical protein